MASYMCCGNNRGNAAVPGDTFRLCLFSSHEDKPVDLLVNLDRRDVAHTAAVLMGALADDAEASAE